ncbi:MAG: hypothetical protein M3Y58_15920 [Chloroflexota bacterium]|nr:hypothetical protein [Chloroflexota bacterium]
MQPALYDEVELLRAYIALPRSLHGVIADIKVRDTGTGTVEFFDEDDTVDIVPVEALRVVRRYTDVDAIREVGD